MATIARQQSSTATPTARASSTTVVTVVDANTGRSGATIFNEGTANLTLHLGSGASPTVYTVVLIPGAYYEVPYGYTGIITGFWAAAGAGNNARIVELS